MSTSTKTCSYDGHQGSSLCNLEEFYHFKNGRISEYCKRCERLRKRIAYWVKQGLDSPPSQDPFKVAMRANGLKLTDYCAVCFVRIDKHKHRSYCYGCTAKMQQVARRLRQKDVAA